MQVCFYSDCLHVNQSITAVFKHYCTIPKHVAEYLCLHYSTTQIKELQSTIYQTIDNDLVTPHMVWTNNFYIHHLFYTTGEWRLKVSAKFASSSLNVTLRRACFLSFGSRSATKTHKITEIIHTADIFRVREDERKRQHLSVFSWLEGQIKQGKDESELFSLSQRHKCGRGLKTFREA